jgi:hypothetical protein
MRPRLGKNLPLYRHRMMSIGKAYPVRNVEAEHTQNSPGRPCGENGPDA